MINKPKLLIIRPSLEKLNSHFRDVGFFNRERGLAFFFTTTVIEDNFNLKKLIDEFSPDLIAFMYDPCTQGGQLKLIHADYNIQIPRILIPIFDAYSLYRWNVYCTYKETLSNAIFTYDTSFGMYYPYLINHTYQWHEFVDINVFKNFGLKKKHDIILTGSFKAANYPWRRKILTHLKKFNYFELIHWNRDHPLSKRKSVVKEDFSKEINQAKIAPTCGGHSRIILGKHFEIPASFTCLITEKTDALIKFGFIDGENCVFADENNIDKKINELLENSSLLEKITLNGYNFVRNNQTAENRSEVLDWFLLFKHKLPNQKIIQTSPLKSIQLVDANFNEKNYYVTDVPPVRLATKGDILLLKGEFKQAKLYYNFFDEIDFDAANSCIRNAIVCLFENKIKEGISSFSKIVSNELELAKGEIIDPMELFIFCILFFKKKEFKLLNEVCKYAGLKLANIESDSLHLDIIRSLALYKSEKQKVALSKKISDYTFCSSHEFLNLDYDHISCFLAKILKLNEKENIFLTELKQLQNIQADKKYLEQNTVKNREDLINVMNKFIYNPTLFSKILYKLKSLPSYITY